MTEGLAAAITALVALLAIYGWVVLLFGATGGDWPEAFVDALVPAAVIGGVLGGIVGAGWLLVTVWAAVPT